MASMAQLYSTVKLVRQEQEVLSIYLIGYEVEQLLISILNMIH